MGAQGLGYYVESVGKKKDEKAGRNKSRGRSKSKDKRKDGKQNPSSKKNKKPKKEKMKKPTGKSGTSNSRSRARCRAFLSCVARELEVNRKTAGYGTNGSGSGSGSSSGSGSGSGSDSSSGSALAAAVATALTRTVDEADALRSPPAACVSVSVVPTLEGTNFTTFGGCEWMLLRRILFGLTCTLGFRHVGFMDVGPMPGFMPVELNVPAFWFILARLPAAG